MEIKLFIVSLACLSCLVPPALGSALVAKAAAIGAVKGAVLGGIKGAAIGAKVGLAAKVIGKKALIGLLLKGAALKGKALLAAKKAAVKGFGSLAVQGLNGVEAATRVVSALADTFRSDCPPTSDQSPILQILSGTARILQNAVRPCEAAEEKAPVVYRVVTAPRLVAVPL